MRFATPEYFIGFLVIVVLAIFAYWSARKKRRLLGIFADAKLLKGLIRDYSPRRRRYKTLFFFMALIILVISMARPQFGTHMELVKRIGQDVVIVIDVSNSMLAEDMRPNRLERAKQEVRGLLDRLQGDRVGIVAFAGAAYIQCPLTLDYSAARLFLDIIDVDLIPQPGTNLPEAISVATDAFNIQERKHKVMIVITDGEDFGEGLEQSVEKAKLAGVRIYTIGIGRPDGEPIPIRNNRGEMIGYKKDRNGELVLTRLDEVTLKQAADATDGKYYHASAGEIALDEIYSDITRMEKKELEERLMTQYEDRFQYILPLAILFLVVEVLISERKRLKQKERGNATA